MPDEKQEMKDQISEEEIRVTAELVNIELDDDSAVRLRSGLVTMLDHFSVIRKVADSSDKRGGPVEKTVDLDDLREDACVLSDSDAALEAAPDFEEGWFFVPRVIE